MSSTAKKMLQALAADASASGRSPSLPTDAEASLARESSRLLAACIGSGPTAKLHVIDGNDNIVVPVRALRMLVDILAQMGEGRGVCILPVKAELTTQQAADFLNVSRPYLVGMLERNELKFRKVGKHRRVLLEDILAYKKEAKRRQEAALQELASQAQELGMGY
jgi:excisionase family DNA binding protein